MQHDLYDAKQYSLQSALRLLPLKFHLEKQDEHIQTAEVEKGASEGTRSRRRARTKPMHWYGVLCPERKRLWGPRQQN